MDIARLYGGECRNVNWYNALIVSREIRLDVFNCSILGSNKIDDKM